MFEPKSRNYYEKTSPQKITGRGGFGNTQNTVVLDGQTGTYKKTAHSATSSLTENKKKTPRPKTQSYLIRWTVHPSEFLKVLLDAGFDGFKGLCIVEPLSLDQFVEKRLAKDAKNKVDKDNTAPFFVQCERQVTGFKTSSVVAD